MKRLDEFRIYYNHTIHPELMRLERSRIKLLQFLFFSLILLIAIVIAELYLNILFITLLLMIPIGVYITYLFYRIRKFVQTFKPNIITLILDFVDDSLNYGTLKYDPKRSISKDTFFTSKLFITKPAVFEGEDHISGKIGELDFELCELNIKEQSPVSSRLINVFQGVFMHARFHYSLEGTILVWPRSQRQHLIKTIKEFTWAGGENVDHEIMTDEFRELFMTYATLETHVAGVLPETMQEAVVNYYHQTGKEIFLSIIDQDIFIGIKEPKDILEPFIFKSNLNFDLVKEFFEDIQVTLSIVEDFDQCH
jgi:hypothetical protein